MRPRPPIFDMLDCPACDTMPSAYGGAGQSLGKQCADGRNITLGQFMSANALAAHIGAGDMFPVIARNDLVESFQGNAVIGANVFPVIASGNTRQNCDNIIFGQFSTSRIAAFILAVQASVIGVLDIFRESSPFKIMQVVVSFIAIDVVGYMLFGWRCANKSHQNKAMDHIGSLPYTAGDKPDREIPALSWQWLQNAVSSASGATRKAFNPAAITGCIYRFPFRDRLPIFHNTSLAE